MPVPIILGAISVGLGAAQYFSGRKKMKDMEKNRPKTPIELDQNIALAQSMKAQGMAKETYQGALQNIQRNQNFGLQALQDRGKALAGVGNLVQRANDAALDLSGQDATIRNQNMLTGTGMELSARQQRGLQKLALDTDYWNMGMGNAMGLQGAGIQNAMGGLQTVGNMYMAQQAYNPGTNFWTGKKN